MSIGLAILLFVIGAILRYAVTVHTSGVDWNTVGVILMWAGGIMAVIWLILYNSLYNNPDRPRWYRRFW
jgi:hypothetical protein